MRLSIVLPIYNVEKYLRRCLDQLEEQMVENVEVILVIDGSTDGSEQICAEYVNKSASFRLISQNNMGVSVARNRGIGEATGEYIAFIDPDDTISQTYIADILQELESVPDILILKYQKCGGSEETEGPYNMWHEGEMDILSLKKSVAYLFLNEVWNKVFRRDIIEQNHIQFQPSMKIAEDICFVMDYIDHVEKAKVAKGIFYYYWINEGSAVRVVKQEHIVDLMKLYDRLLVFSVQNGLQDGSVNQPSDYVLQCVAQLLDEGVFRQSDVIGVLQNSGLIGKIRQFPCHGIKNKLLLCRLSALSSGKYLLSNLYKLLIQLYDCIKG